MNRVDYWIVTAEINDEILGKPSEAIEWYEKAYDALTKDGDWREAANRAYDIGELYAHQLKQHQKAIEWYRKGFNALTSTRISNNQQSGHVTSTIAILNCREFIKRLLILKQRRSGLQYLSIFENMRIEKADKKW